MTDTAHVIIGGLLGIFAGAVIVLVAPAIGEWLKWLFKTRRRNDPLSDPRTAREWVPDTEPLGDAEFYLETARDSIACAAQLLTAQRHYELTAKLSAAAVTIAEVRHTLSNG